MIALSLLKNIEEVLTFKIRKLPIPDSHSVNPDIKWVADEYDKWSKQYSCNNPYVDKALVIWLGLMPVWTTDSVRFPTKQRLLNYLKGIETFFYLDAYMKPYRTKKSGENAAIMIETLISALKTGQSDQEIGKRLIDGMQAMKSDMDITQWSRIEAVLEKCFRKHLDVHSNYWLKNRFIEFNKYVDKRLYESLWNFISVSLEYLFEYPIPEDVRSSQTLVTFERKCTELWLAADDHYMTVHKMMTNDATSRVICYAHHYKCSVQEAFDVHFEYTVQLYNECKQLLAQLIAKPEGSNLFRQCLETRLATTATIYPTLTSIEEMVVNADQTVRSDRWQQLYRGMADNRAQVIPWNI